jgi:hypothetical protein
MAKEERFFAGILAGGGDGGFVAEKSTMTGCVLPR